MSRVGDEGYNLVWNNCEHFAERGGLGQRWSDGGSSGVRGSVSKNWASRLWGFFSRKHSDVVFLVLFFRGGDFGVNTPISMRTLRAPGNLWNHS